MTLIGEARQVAEKGDSDASAHSEMSHDTKEKKKKQKRVVLTAPTHAADEYVDSTSEEEAEEEWVQ